MCRSAATRSTFSSTSAPTPTGRPCSGRSPQRRNRDLLRLLVAYELIWDTLDNLSESAAAHGQSDGRQLHLAIAEAIDLDTPISDYYAQHPWQNDGGYLRSLVETCRESCRSLPSFPQVRESRASRGPPRASAPPQPPPRPSPARSHAQAMGRPRVPRSVAEALVGAIRRRERATHDPRAPSPRRRNPLLAKRHSAHLCRLLPLALSRDNDARQLRRPARRHQERRPQLYRPLPRSRQRGSRHTSTRPGITRRSPHPPQRPQARRNRRRDDRDVPLQGHRPHTTACAPAPMPSYAQAERSPACCTRSSEPGA